MKTSANVRALLPAAGDYSGLRAGWRADLVAGLTVAVVALPLALGFGVASGLGAGPGLVTAIVAGIVAAVFGGSHVQVSGPTGAMTVVLVPIVAAVGPGGVVVVGVLAGALLVLAGVLRLGRFAGLLPWPVVEGFTIGIALLIALQQVPPALGVAAAEGGNALVTATAAVGDWAGSGWQAPVMAVAVVMVIELLARAHRALPAALLAVAAATLVAQLAGLGVARIGAIPTALPQLTLPAVDAGEFPGLVSAALVVAALAAIESLLSAKVADGMADGAAHDPDRELLGQGLANITAVVGGGMPATGAIARTAVNVRAGARTRVAAITHGAVLIAAVLLITPLLERIPLAALAGVLIATALRMADLDAARRIVRSSRADALLLLATAGATVAFDLITAVAIGVVLAGVHALVAVAGTASFRREPPPHEFVDDELEHALLHERIIVFRLDGALFFGAAQRFLDELTAAGPVETVILRLDNLRLLDSTGAHAIGDLVQHLERQRVTVLLCGGRPEHVALLQRCGALDRLRHERHLLPDLPAALAHARRHHERVADRVAVAA